MSDVKYACKRLGVSTRELPVSLSDAKAHLNVEHSEDDRLILMYLQAATDYVEHEIGGPIMLCMTRLTASAFPKCGVFSVSSTPISSVESVTYYDADDVETVMPSEYYVAYPVDGYPSIQFIGTPPTAAERYDAVKIDFWSGLASKQSDVPAALIAAVQLMTGHLYSNRENASPLNMHELPVGVSSLLRDFRVY